MTKGRVTGKIKFQNWEKMRKELKRRFLPSTNKQDCYHALCHLEQGNKSVDDYTKEFELLMIKCDMRDPEDLTICRYLSGLHIDLAGAVRLHPCHSFVEVCVLARKLEKQQKAVKKATSFRNITKINSFDKPNTNPNPRLIANKNVDKSGEGTSKVNDVKCYRCQDIGYIASECPNKRIVTVREYDDWRSLHSNLDMEEEEQQEDDFQEVLEANPMEGELLVVRTSLATISTEEEKVQRENLFRTRGSVQGKVCDIIIDNGSCTNVASKYMVDKLKLKT